MTESVRLQIYTILILVSAGLMFGRIMAVDSVADRTVQELRLAQIPKRLTDRRADLQKRGVEKERINADLKTYLRRLLADAKKERPTLSANDRSRWLTIRALVEPDTRVYRYLPLDENGRKKPLYKIGEVKRNCSCECSDRFEKKNLSAGAYEKQWVPYAIDKAMETSGWETIDMVKHGLPDEEYDPANPLSGYLYSSKPTLLPTLMAAPYWLIYHTTGRSLRSDPFLMTRLLLVILNLIPLTVGWYYTAKLIDRFGTTDWGRVFAMATLCFATFLSTFAVTLNNHLPGAVCVMLAVYAASRILADGRRNIRYFLSAGFFGALAVACELPAALIALVLCAALVWKSPKKTLGVAVPAGLIVAAGFFGTNIAAHGSIRPAYAQKRDHVALAQEQNPNVPQAMQVKSFDPNDWYVYRFIPAGKIREPKNSRLSYWSNRIGIDRGEPSRRMYLLHTTIGHHGLFSLSPVWILSMAGLFMLLVQPGETQRLGRGFAVSVLLMTAIFYAFYLSRDQGDRSYGGMTSGLRWFFPLIAFWILGMLPLLDRWASGRLGRGVALTLLFFSAMSVAYPVWNPWSHPWFYFLMLQFQWIGG